MKKAVSILGTRGIPARHGGFETFAERLALHLAARGWDVTVYCQLHGAGARSISESRWRNIRLIGIPVRGSGPASTIAFDWRATVHSLSGEGIVLTLGYNTAVFGALLRIAGRQNIINMDGMEWRRKKWSLPARAWLYANERLGCWIGSRLIADHPAIGRHLATRVDPAKVTVIPYGADEVADAPPGRVEPFGLEPGGYALIVARPEPENSILEVVRAFCASGSRLKLAILGSYRPGQVAFHRKVVSAADNRVRFLGAVYDGDALAALRRHCRFYVHGHQVGGTNPALVEALGAGCAVLAHDNEFNRWVAGTSARYFADESLCARQIEQLARSDDTIERMRGASRRRFHQSFHWDPILARYEDVLDAALEGAPRAVIEPAPGRVAPRWTPEAP